VGLLLLFSKTSEKLEAFTKIVKTRRGSIVAFHKISSSKNQNCKQTFARRIGPWRQPGSKTLSDGKVRYRHDLLPTHSEPIYAWSVLVLVFGLRAIRTYRKRYSRGTQQMRMKLKPSKQSRNVQINTQAKDHKSSYLATSTAKFGGARFPRSNHALDSSTIEPCFSVSELMFSRQRRWYL
jgi:hypothetical protein